MDVFWTCPSLLLKATITDANKSLFPLAYDNWLWFNQLLRNVIMQYAPLFLNLKDWPSFLIARKVFSKCWELHFLNLPIDIVSVISMRICGKIQASRAEDIPLRCWMSDSRGGFSHCTLRDWRNLEKGSQIVSKLCRLWVLGRIVFSQASLWAYHFKYRWIPQFRDPESQRKTNPWNVQAYRHSVDGMVWEML